MGESCSPTSSSAAPCSPSCPASPPPPPPPSPSAGTSSSASPPRRKREAPAPENQACTFKNCSECVKKGSHPEPCPGRVAGRDPDLTVEDGNVRYLMYYDSCSATKKSIETNNFYAQTYSQLPFCRRVFSPSRWPVGSPRSPRGRLDRPAQHEEEEAELCAHHRHHEVPKVVVLCVGAAVEELNIQGFLAMRTNVAWKIPYQVKER